MEILAKLLIEQGVCNRAMCDARQGRYAGAEPKDFLAPYHTRIWDTMRKRRELNKGTSRHTRRSDVSPCSRHNSFHVNKDITLLATSQPGGAVM